jgi:hypothetical protein
MCATLQLQFVDLITEPGMDGLVAREPDRAAQVVLPKARLSIARHASPLLAIAAHHDCLANPGSEQEHREQLIAGVKVLRGWNLGVKIIALWVSSDWQVQVVQTLVLVD